MEASQHAFRIKHAGGTPVILRIDQDPSRMLEELDAQGIVLSGGGDIAASRYGGNPALVTEGVNLQRDAFEFALLEAALARRLPILAVCRGAQLVNVAFGGTLIEDLRTHLGKDYRVAHHQIDDARQKREDYAHDIIVTPGARLHAVTGADRCRVNSFHHQAIGELAPCLWAVARSEDGIVEAVEFSGGGRAFFLGVQWHPEQLPGDPVTQHLYEVFLEACRTSRAWGFQDAAAPDSPLDS